MNLLCATGFLACLQGVASQHQRGCRSWSEKNLNLSWSFPSIPSLKNYEVRTLKSGCLWWVAPPCSTWVFLSRGSTGRSYTRARGWGSWVYVAVVSKATYDGCIPNLLHMPRHVFFAGRITSASEGTKGQQAHQKNHLRVTRLKEMHTHVLSMHPIDLADQCHVFQVHKRTNKQPWHIHHELSVLRCEYLFKKGVHYCIENPMTTLLWTYRPMEVMADIQFFLLVTCFFFQAIFPRPHFVQVTWSRSRIWSKDTNANQSLCHLVPMGRRVRNSSANHLGLEDFQFHGRYAKQLMLDSTTVSQIFLWVWYVSFEETGDLDYNCSLFDWAGNTTGSIAKAWLSYQIEIHQSWISVNQCQVVKQIELWMTWGPWICQGTPSKAEELPECDTCKALQGLQGEHQS